MLIIAGQIPSLMPDTSAGGGAAIKIDRQKEAGNDLVFSYLTLRNIIGISGMLLPLVLVLAAGRGTADRWIEPSISDYYYSSKGDVLVVMLSILGVFLITYTGYKWQENLLTTIAAVAGLGVAFSPTATNTPNSFSIHVGRAEVPLWFGIERHFVFACLFFISLAAISLHYFPRTNKASLLTPGGKRLPKAKRNMVYLICGWIMVFCVAILGIHFIIDPLPDFFGIPPVFLFETIAIEAFGISWLTKGETLWPDGEHYLVKIFRRFTGGPARHGINRAKGPVSLFQ